MSESRGQMILIAAVLVSVAILGSVVLVNSLHAPADLTTEADGRSLAALEGATGQVSSDLEAVFLVHTSVNDTGERMPYANESGGPDPDFAETVANYSAVQADLTASGTSAVVSVEYLNTSQGSQNGTFIRQNDTARELADPSPWTALEDVDSLPYLYLRVNGTDTYDNPLTSTNPFTLKIDGTDVLSFEGERVTDGGGNTLLEGDTNDELYPVEVELIDGVGEVRNDTLREPLAITVSPGSNVTFEDGGETTGAYAMSGTDADGSDLIGVADARDHQYVREEVLVNPRFRLNVTEANIVHSRTFALYNRTEP